MADYLGNLILYNAPVRVIDFIDRSVGLSDGRHFSADVVINTIPWREFTVLGGVPGGC